MALAAEVRYFLETQLFKGKITDERRGRGGLIYIVERSGEPKHVAYKTVQEFENGCEVSTERFDREAANWFRFAGHPLIIRPHFVEMYKGFPLVCMPYCDGDLGDFVEKELSLTAVVCLSLQVVKGLLAANQRGMKHHQDMKPENVLYIDLSKKLHNFPPEGVDASAVYSVRIADFGVANAWQNKYGGGTNPYKPPEQHGCTDFHGFEPDIFAVGVIIAELYQGHHPAAKTRGESVRKWRQGDLKRWSVNGVRHFAKPDNPQAKQLVDLAMQMIAPDPAARPLLQTCYDRLAGLLSELSPMTLAQLQVQFTYFDELSIHAGLEADISRKIKLAAIPSQRASLNASMLVDLKEALGGDRDALDNSMRVHHLARGLLQLSAYEEAPDNRDVLVEASTFVVRFVLKHRDQITSDSLCPAYEFGLAKPAKLFSDFEANAEVLNEHVGYLQRFGALSEELQVELDAGGNFAQACRLLHQAQLAHQGNYRKRACELLDEVLQLVPMEPELEDLRQRWAHTREIFGDEGFDKILAGEASA